MPEGVSCAGNAAEVSNQILQDKVDAFDACLTEVERITEQGGTTSRWLLMMDTKKVCTSRGCTTPRTDTSNPGYRVYDPHGS